MSGHAAVPRTGLASTRGEAGLAGRAARRAVPRRAARACTSCCSHLSTTGDFRLPKDTISVLDSQAELARRRQAIKRKLGAAVREEDYAACCELRDELKELDSQDPVLQLKRRLRAAIQEERYDEAAGFRDQIEALCPSPKNTSDCLTHGVRVRVTSCYVPSRSSPHLGQYFFTYKVQISNEGSKAVQVRNRHWVITNAQGRVDEVKGPGVVGEQPVLKPGEFFEYTSACPLQTSYGTMEGKYEVLVLEGSEAEPSMSCERLEVKIGRFALVASEQGAREGGIGNYDCTI